MPVFAFESETGFKFGSTLVVFPHLMKAGFPRLGGQAFLLMNIAFRIAIEFQKPGLLFPVPTVGQYDQYFSLRRFQAQSALKNTAAAVNAFIHGIGLEPAFGRADGAGDRILSGFFWPGS